MLVPLDSASDAPCQDCLEEVLVLAHSDFQFSIELDESIGGQVIVEGNFDVPALVAAVRRVEARAIVGLKPELVGWPEFTFRLVQATCHQRIVAGSLFHEGFLKTASLFDFGNDYQAFAFESGDVARR